MRDINGDGQINNGGELFGEGTVLADGTKAKDGYVAMRALDSNNDGVLMNVHIGYAGMLNKILRGGITDEDDLWSIENMTMVLLGILSNPARFIV